MKKFKSKLSHGSREVITTFLMRKKIFKKISNKTLKKKCFILYTVLPHYKEA